MAARCEVKKADQKAKRSKVALKKWMIGSSDKILSLQFPCCWLESWLSETLLYRAKDKHVSLEAFYAQI